MSGTAAEGEIVEVATDGRTGQLGPNGCLGGLLKGQTRLACWKHGEKGKQLVQEQIMQEKQLPRGSMRMFHASVGILHEEN